MTIFSKIIAGEVPCYKIAENNSSFALLDANPLVNGHVLVLSRRETDYFFDIPSHFLSDMIEFSQEIAVAMRKALPCKRIGVAIIGLEVPHAHIHLVPINNAEDMDFAKQRMNLTPAQFQQTADDIRRFLPPNLLTY